MPTRQLQLVMMELAVDDGLLHTRNLSRVLEKSKDLLITLFGTFDVAILLAAVAELAVVGEDDEVSKSNLVREAPKERGKTFPCPSRIC